jgi:hypothetical protein
MNNAAPVHAVGRVNSLATLESAVMRLVAPIVGTVMFAYTANLDLFYPLNYFFVFHFNTFVCLLAVLLSLGLPAVVNRHRAH